MDNKINQEEKSLRWLALQFRKVENPKDDAERLCNCINLYCTNGADLINRQQAEIEKKDIEIDIMIRKKEALNDEVSKLRAEVEQWKEEANKYQNWWCEAVMESEQ